MKLYCNLILDLDFVYAVYVGGAENFLKGEFNTSYGNAISEIPL